MAYKLYEDQLRHGREKYQRNLREKPFWQRCYSLKASCKRRNLPFDLTPEFLEGLWTGVCGYSGQKVNLQSPTRKSDNHAELDRIIPSLGYVQSNVIWVSRRFNRIKSDGTADEHRLIAERIDALRREYEGKT